MATFYTDVKTAQIVLALLKAHNIRRVIASPGTANMALVVSMQHDPFFEMYSAVDERSAAYMACGLAAETGEPVVISCTGATASRNYLPGLTEAYYRKLPVLAITSTQPVSKAGHLHGQIIDRSQKPVDTVRFSVTLPLVKDDEDFWDCEVKVNRAILELHRHGGGPVHINLPTIYGGQFDVPQLPSCRRIDRITCEGPYPELPKGSIAILVGSHKTWSKLDIEAVDRFCESNGAIVICDHTSGYRGKYRVLYSLIGAQRRPKGAKFTPDLLIHIGEITGDYYSLGVAGREVWRVSEDGEIRDTFRKLRYVFEMPERLFFSHYAKETEHQKDILLQQCRNRLHQLRERLPEVPFSNIWIASKIAHRIPPGSVVHFGILNSLRSWNFFELPESVTSASNVGGFGIDGGLSSLIGASFANRNRLYFGAIGDLAFFYDMNSIGNRHVGRNLRILLVNNGKGTEFRQYAHPAANLGTAADDFVSGAGHFGNQSRTLVKHYAEDLGFDYLSASTKEEFERVVDRFLHPEVGERSIIFEVFTDSREESKALEMVMNIEADATDKAKEAAKRILGRRTTALIKNILRCFV
jgi:2-succinyl-6-hydroxy-2,4-cyclohexadiene-1-carboxylate synthase